MASWHFMAKRPGDTIREPIYGEFFAADAISDPGRALVREAIQNSLDATQPGQKLTVRVFLSGTQSAVRFADANSWFAGAREHFDAPDNGLRSDDIPKAEEACPFLVFEDFGTFGLEGDVGEAFKPRTGRKNRFYHFFRAEGQSDKDESDRGSWGVGKHVFIRSSRVSTIFGLTVRREDGQRLLMGKTVLKSHWIASDYFQDGFFGVAPSPEQPLVMPVTDPATIRSFCNLFQLQREQKPGLSLVIPWPDQDVNERALISAIVLDYFYPILTGELEVRVETPSVQTVLSAETLRDEIERLDSDISADLLPLVELAIWGRQLGENDRLTIAMPNSGRAWAWNRDLIDEELLSRMRDKMVAGERIAVRVPVTVRPKTGEPRPSYFDVYLVRDNSENSGRPTFVREGIIVSRVDSPRTRGVRAIVIVQDIPLAAFLRASENPSHTEWQHVRLKSAYKNGYKGDLLFVKRSVHELVQILTAIEQAEDPTLLTDFFSLPAPEESINASTTRVKKPRKRKGTQPPFDQNPRPAKKPARFQIQRVTGGFSVLPGDSAVEPPRRIEIRLAYSIRRGNPLAKYDKADFDVSAAPILFEPEPRGIEVIERDGNRIVIGVCDRDFMLRVTGFDERRDLFVRAIAKEDAGGDTSA